MRENLLASDALRAASRVRQKCRVSPWQALCPLDAAETLGVDVVFLSMPSGEGLYTTGSPPTILLNSERPAGRQRYTCAHELGHHVFNHGWRVDELLSDGSGPRAQEERLADLFAGFLLMSKTAVLACFGALGAVPTDPTPEQAYVVSGWLGVSYEALIRHASLSLNLMPQRTMERLINDQPKAIRARLLGRSASSDVFVADPRYSGCTLNLQVGDLLLVPDGARFLSKLLSPEPSCPGHLVYSASAPGVDTLAPGPGGGELAIRVRPAQFVGRAIYRHIEEDEEEDSNAG